MKSMLRWPFFFLFIVFWSHWLCTGAEAHRTFGLFYPASEAHLINEAELERLDRSGIGWLMVEESLSETQRKLLTEKGLSLMVLQPEYFPVPRRLENPAYRYGDRADSLFRLYRDDPLVAGIGWFAFGNWDTTRNSEIERLIRGYPSRRNFFVLDPRPLSGDQIFPFDGIVMLTRSASDLARQLGENPALLGVLYAPEADRLDLRDFQEMLSLLHYRRDLPVFFYRNWYMQNYGNSVVEPGVDIGKVTGFFARIPDARMANPEPPQKEKRPDLSMVLLFLFWALYAIHYRLSPMYRRSVIRFFMNYDYFVNDVLMRRIRFAGDVIILFLVISLSAGVMAFAVAQNFLTTISREAFIYHLPFVPRQWSHPFRYFLLFAGIAAIVNAVQVIWLGLANRSHAHIHQVATLLLWPQHVNLVVVSAGVVLIRTFPLHSVVLLMSLVFWAMTILSFFLAAYNLRRVQPTSPLYMASTYALYMVAITLVLFWIIFFLQVPSAWNLAVSLS